MKASMPLTHQYLLNIVEEAGGLNEERLAWFYQRYIKSEQVKYTPELASVIKQLHYLGKIEKRGRYWCRPWHEPDYTLLRCLDVMMALADDVLPKFVYKRETKTLTFFLPTGDDGGENVFLLYVVTAGQESYVSTLASAQMMPPGHTVLYLLENSMQLSKLFCNNVLTCSAGQAQISPPQRRGQRRMSSIIVRISSKKQSKPCREASSALGLTRMELCCCGRKNSSMYRCRAPGRSFPAQQM